MITEHSLRRGKHVPQNLVSSKCTGKMWITITLGERSSTDIGSCAENDVTGEEKGVGAGGSCGHWIVS